MKKIFLTFGLITSTFIFASTPTTNECQKFEKVIKTSIEKNKSANNFNPDRTYNGVAGYDTVCCGTCFTYGTYEEWDLGNGMYIERFTPASQATIATLTLPPCTGAGSYLA